MLIESIKLTNFRCMKDVFIPCEPLTALVGRNGAGKSSTLQAISIFYDVGYRVQEDDFCERDTSNPIEITITFNSLSEDEDQEFKAYINNGQLVVTKKLSLEDGGKYYASAKAIRDFAEFYNSKSKTEKRAIYSALREKQAYQELPSARNADECLQNLINFEEQHPEQCEMITRETQFFGPSSIGGGKLDKFTKFVLVPAVKEVADELSGRGRTYLQKLLDLAVLRKVNARPDVQQLKQEMDKRIKEVYSSHNLTELPTVGTEISQLLKRYAPDSEFHLEWDEVQPPEISLPSAIATVTEDGFRGDIGRKGHGLQRSLIFAILEYINTITPEPEPEGEAQTDKKETSSSHSPKLILGIEEPELYQHPLKCRFLSKLLRNLANTGENQIMYTTHSPYFVDLELYSNVRLIKKVPSSSEVRHGEVNYCGVPTLISRMRELANNHCVEFTSESFKAHASPVMDAIVNEGFFADAVVVVEGFGDLGCLWALQEILRLEWAAKGIAVVPARGKNNIDRPVTIFSEFKIPTFFIFDGDASNRGKSEENNTIETNKRLQKLAGVSSSSNWPDSQINDSWACFNDCIETYLFEELGEQLFSALASEIRDRLGYPKQKGIFKNLDGMAAFINAVYSNGRNLPFLEELVSRATMLVS